MKKAYVFGGIGIIVVTTIVLAILFWPKNTDEIPPSASKQKGEQPSNKKEKLLNSQTDLAETHSTESIPAEPEKEFHGNLYRIEPSRLHYYHFNLEVVPESSDPYVWLGDIAFRSESAFSDTTIKSTNSVFPGRPLLVRPTVSHQLGTGIVIPEGGVLVGSHFLVGANSVSVKVGQRWKPASIVSTFDDSEFALLQVEGLNAKVIPISPKNKFDRESNLAWLNYKGELQVLKNIKYSEYTNSQGGRYLYRRNVKDDCIGGAIFDQFGNLDGLIVDSNHPQVDIKAIAKVRPLKKIAEVLETQNTLISGPEKSDQTDNEFESLLSSQLVQVRVKRTPKEPKVYSAFIYSNISAPRSIGGKRIGQYVVPSSLKSQSGYRVATKPFLIEKMGRSTRSIPFFLGSIADLFLFPYRELEATSPVKLFRNGFEHCRSTDANGQIVYSDLKLVVGINSIKGSRRCDLDAKTKPSAGPTNQIEVSADLQHEFELRPSDNLPLRSILKGKVTIDTHTGPKTFTVSMDLKQINK